ncbi:39S ribosomal protein L46, mitochondrial isoform X1 [Solea solea]|uniref:39S ribosomal protein L46, mitochondrial isoform X1 n=1 Tax=Solea solea TaxID=90069 RepID=UPI00272BB8E0|nr:39S ribosomal protein L46, mitochondrial isoform X1 [Solea solea]
MAAACGGAVGRPLCQLLSCLSRTAVSYTWRRHFSATSLCRTTLQTQRVTESAGSPWTLMAAVCLQRLPVISADCHPVEQRFKQLTRQMEREKSLFSDHELRLLEDAERMNRKRAGSYDSDEEDDNRGQDIVLAQDLEDSWEQKLKKFQPAPRVKAVVDEDLTSVERCLADSLVLLAEQQVGSEKLWLLPQAEWQEGDTLRQTAERALASLPAAGFSATFLSNAPCGVYKYKLPKAARTDSLVGTKVFFFKAVLSSMSPSTASNAPLMWLKKSELQRFVKPAYTMKVERFILDP